MKCCLYFLLFSIHCFFLIFLIQLMGIERHCNGNKGLEIDNNDKWNENNTQQHCLFHDQAMSSEWFCKPFKQFMSVWLVNQSYNQSYRLIIFSSIWMACQSVWHYLFYSSIWAAKQTIWMAYQIVEIIYSPIQTVCLFEIFSHPFKRLTKPFK